MRKYDQIIIVNNYAFGYKCNKMCVKWYCVYLAYLPDINMLKDILKKMYPNTSIVSNMDNRYMNLKTDLRKNSEILASAIDSKPLIDLTSVLRDIRIDEIFN